MRIEALADSPRTLGQPRPQRSGPPPAEPRASWVIRRQRGKNQKNKKICTRQEAVFMSKSGPARPSGLASYQTLLTILGRK